VVTQLAAPKGSPYTGELPLQEPELVRVAPDVNRGDRVVVDCDLALR
jgi:hypothetical protein